MHPQLSICAFLAPSTLVQAISDALSHLPETGSTGIQYQVTAPRSNEEFYKFIEQEKHHLDCLILQRNSNLPSLANWLHRQATLLPAVIILPEDAANQTNVPAEKVNPVTPLDQGSNPEGEAPFTYHIAEVSMPMTEVNDLRHYIDQAIARFINLSPACRVTNATSTAEVNKDLSTQNFLLLQQRRLTEKLKERLGYLGVYFKRNPQNYLRHLPPEEKQELLEKLRTDYRDIVLCYFLEDGTLNQRIDDFVNIAFFTDVPTSQIVEIHMDLMDEFSKQLKLEGRSEEILLDYRLTLIDVIAHVCEMYRRSIPGNLKDENL